MPIQPVAIAKPSTPATRGTLPTPASRPMPVKGAPIIAADSLVTTRVAPPKDEVASPIWAYLPNGNMFKHPRTAGVSALVAVGFTAVAGWATGVSLAAIGVPAALGVLGGVGLMAAYGMGNVAHLLLDAPTATDRAVASRMGVLAKEFWAQF